MAVETNQNFERLLEELGRMGDEAFKRSSDDPTYQQFLQAFPVGKLLDLSLSQYCVGKGGKDSFCWWIERGLESQLGRYMPGTSKGHILYFKKDGAVYKNTYLSDLSDDEALKYTLRIQSCIANANVTQAISWIDDDQELYARANVEPRTTVGQGRKLRLLACYHPEETIPISSASHLRHFLEMLGYPPDSIPGRGRPVAKMLVLREYFEKAKAALPNLSPRGFMQALYSERLGLAPEKDSDLPDDAVLVDTKAVSNGNSEELAVGRPPLNQILYGPPGTGKTYATVDAALAILAPDYLARNRADRAALKARFDELSKEQRIRFVTFHQSFSYEDFVEGLRSTTDEATGALRYEVSDGVFKLICGTVTALAKPQKSAGIDIQGRKIWKMSLGNTLGEDAEIYDECLADNSILLGYGGVIDFSGCKTRDDVVAKYEAAGESVTNAQTDYKVTSVVTFVTQISKGDLVVVTDGNQKFRAIGEVTGDYAFKPHAMLEEYSQSRAVHWLRQYTPSLPHTELMNKKFSQMTIYQLHSGSIDLAKLQKLLNGGGTGAGYGSLRIGPIGDSDYAISRVTDDFVELTKPNGNRVPFSRQMLEILAEGVRTNVVSVAGIRKKEAVEKLPGKGLEPYLVNGYNNVLAPLIDVMVGPQSEPAVSDGALAGDSARVLIIDEINRGNISRIFGELITLIEPSKRAGADEALEVVLPYSKKPFTVPSNVYLIGTMNTADRSLTAIDVALRRRFVFKEMLPKPGLLGGVKVGDIEIDVLMRTINERIEALLDRDHVLGHAIFMPLRGNNSQAKLAEIFRHQVLPLLQEYFYDDWDRIQWVLNDHRKRNPAYCFVSASEVDSSRLFGEGVNTRAKAKLWSINDSAFLSEQSYLGVIDHEVATD